MNVRRFIAATVLGLTAATSVAGGFAAVASAQAEPQVQPSEQAAKGSSAVVSLGKLGRVELAQTREHILLARQVG